MPAFLQLQESGFMGSVTPPKCKARSTGPIWRWRWQTNSPVLPRDQTFEKAASFPNGPKWFSWIWWRRI